MLSTLLALLVFAIIGFMGWCGKKYAPQDTKEEKFEEGDSA